MKTYSVSVWDHEAEDFVPRYYRLSARKAVEAVRQLEIEGYDREASIYVARNYTKAEIAEQRTKLKH